MFIFLDFVLEVEVDVRHGEEAIIYESEEVVMGFNIDLG